MRNIAPVLNRKRNQGGFALIIILSVLVLLLALVVGFFSRVQGELQSSSTYQSANSARNLSEYAVNLVMTQIKAGTAGKDSGGSITAWASQPGAIRTYTTTGDLKSIYKLYSSPTMVTTSINPSAETASISGWASSPALFTDLNEPINNQYPILDPGALGTVKGFSVTGAPAVTSGNLIPMPGHWLYVLKDGTVVAPTGGTTATVPGATSNNPIVGRIAFWTDDETSKININTAGGGPWSESNVNLSTPMVGGVLTYSGPPFTSFVATPQVYTAQDGALGLYQPAQHEYQRYPGHPATTFLSAALPDLNLASIYSILPRLENDGSTQGGTVKITNPVTGDSDRLYQSVDELAFTRDRTANSGVDKTSLEKAKFFLTAASRAPDVNMFNEPKIGLWPINANTAKRTPFDRVIEFCQKINGNAYYFTRDDPDSATTDINLTRNKQLISYLRNKTSDPVPGFGGSGGILGHYGTKDQNQTLTEIFDYIRTTNPRESSQVTSAGAVDSSYYYSETGAVVPSKDSATQTMGFGRFPVVNKIGLLFYTVATNQDAADQNTTKRDAPPYRVGLPEDDGKPIAQQNIPDKGFSRVRAILLLEMFIPGQGYDYVFPRCSIEVTGLNTLTWADGTTRMFDKGSGTLTFNQTTVRNQELIWQRGYNSNPWGGRIGMLNMLAPFIALNGKELLDPDLYPFAGIGGATSEMVPNREDHPAATFSYNGGRIGIRIKNRLGQTIQDYTIPIPTPTQGVPVPYLAPLITGPKEGAKDFRKVVDRLRLSTDSVFYSFVKAQDVIRAVSVDSGDYRLIAAREFPNENLFRPHPFYNTGRDMAHAFMLSMPTANYGAGLGSYANNTDAPVSSAANYDITTSPVYSFKKNDNVYSFSNPAYLVETPTLTGVKVGGNGSVAGDWDLGVGRTGDGPYINYPDEGNTGTASNTLVPYFGNVDSRGQLGKGNFSPNRMMPSAVMLGSLPSQLDSEKPWQTLLFRPTSDLRPGSGIPLTGPPFTQAPDYLLLDFFNMPVVEPYAISEPLSTAGKVNMNYQILPYTYIERSTAMQAVLRSELMLAIPNNQGLLYRDDGNKAVGYRSLLNLDQSTGTLKGFADRFAAGEIFRSPSEICSIWLVPSGQSYGTMPTFWNNHQLTADNGKEQSYARIYPRLTTKSNTYTVHYRVQTLKKPKGAANQAQWQENVDKVQAEYRGSTTIERYIDPNDANIPDYITASNPQPLDSFYKFRVISQKQFNP